MHNVLLFIIDESPRGKYIFQCWELFHMPPHEYLTKKREFVKTEMLKLIFGRKRKVNGFLITFQEETKKIKWILKLIDFN